MPIALTTPNTGPINDGYDALAGSTPRIKALAAIMDKLGLTSATATAS